MRITTVNAARKEQKCDKCQSRIKKGESYRWAKGRYTRKMVRCMKAECAFRPTDLSSAKTAQIDEAINDAHTSLHLAEDLDAIKAVLEDVASVARDVAQEYQDANDAWAGGQGREDLQEKVDACEAFADELEGWDPSGETDEETIRQQVRDEEDGPEQGEDQDDYTKRLEELGDAAWEQALEEMRNEAEGVLDSFST